MEYLKKNKKILAERFQDVLEVVEDKEKTSSDILVRTVDARDGNHVLLVEKDGEKHRLNSAYRPLSEAQKWAEQFEFQNIDINVFMFGFGNGIFVREILHRLDTDGRLYVFEPSWEIFEKVIEEEDISDILGDSRFRLLMGDKGITDLKEIMRSVVGWHNLATQIQCSHIGYHEIYPEMSAKFWDGVAYSNALARVRSNTNIHFSHIAVENVLANLKYIKKSNYITELIGKIPEKTPAIIVAAGPSLEKNIELLKDAYGKAFIIAVDTAVKILEDRKIPYDCMVTVDPAKPARYFTDYPRCKEKTLFCAMESRKEILAFHRGRKIWLEGSFYLEGLYRMYGMEFPEHNVGGSVATVAFMIAKNIGLKNIVLLGQDLAYEGERTHAGNEIGHIKDEESTKQMVEGIDGGEVMTRGDWIIYLKWFEEMIKDNPQLNVVDATEGGALIHGSKVMTLAEVIEEYCEGREFSFEQLIKDLKPTFEVVDYEPIRQVLLRMGKGIKNIRSKSQAGIQYTDEFIGAGRKISAKKHDRLLKEIKKANNYIANQMGYELLDMYTSDLTDSDLENVNQITGDIYVDEVNTVKAARSVYQGMLEAADALKDMVDEAMKNI